MARCSPDAALQASRSRGAVARAACLVAPLALAAAIPPATAQVWRCQSDAGVVEYTNTPRSRCARLDPAPLSSAPVAVRPATVRTGVVGVPAGTSSGASSGAPAPVPANARIDAATQRARDSDRRRILEDELRKEAGRLDELRREVAAAAPGRRAGEGGDPRHVERLARLREDIGRSEGNVSALRRELASLRD